MTKIKCKKCGSEKLSVMVDVTLSIPIDYLHNLSKAKIRSKCVQLWSANWDKADIVCNDCFYSTKIGG